MTSELEQKVQRYLEGAEYPASKGDLASGAKKNEAPQEFVLQQASLVKRSTTSCQQCEHDGPMMIDHVQGGYVSQCLRCERWGPIGKTPGKARRLLMSLGGGTRSVASA